jgi:UDP-GlcNAc:undecaprenyl-phosphate GlcNAc-1-phosphate transferase
LGISFLITPLVRNTFLRLGVVDAPDGGRKLHASPIPRIGGVAVAISYAAAFGVLLLSPLRGAAPLRGGFDMVLHLLPATVLIFFLGVVDDLFPVRPVTKFAVQVCAALLAYWGGVRWIYDGALPFDNAWWSLPLTLFWIVLCTNAFNLIDGVDGLASGVGLFATVTALAAALMNENYPLAMATAPLAGALLGFLRYNFNPATIFLGDSGSYLIGFLLGCFGVLWSHKAVTLVGLTAPLIALAIPLLDTGISVVRRFISGRPLFTADRGHIHHKLMDRGWTPRRAVIALYGVSGLCAVMSLLLATGRSSTGVVLILFVATTWIGVQNLGYIELSTAGRVIRQRGFRKMLSAQMTLRVLQMGLEAAQGGKEVWAALRKGVPALGFSSASLHYHGEQFEETFGERASDQESWSLSIPLGRHGLLELEHSFASGGSSMTGQLAKVVRDAILAKPEPAPKVRAMRAAG